MTLLYFAIVELQRRYASHSYRFLAKLDAFSVSCRSGNEILKLVELCRGFRDSGAESHGVIRGWGLDESDLDPERDFVAFCADLFHRTNHAHPTTHLPASACKRGAPWGSSLWTCCKVQ
jgi:hypothetical protein